eukprot:898890-Pyramimonas_sp.AAC.1
MLSLEGWEPELHAIIQGTLGEVTTTSMETLAKLAVKGPRLSKLASDLHRIALKWMNKCIDTERKLDHQMDKELVHEDDTYEKRSRECGGNQPCSARRARVRILLGEIAVADREVAKERDRYEKADRPCA